MISGVGHLIVFIGTESGGEMGAEEKDSCMSYEEEDSWALRVVERVRIPGLANPESGRCD